MNPEIPAPDDVTREWWDATREHRLTVQGCDACGHVQHPPRALCTGCGRLDTLALRPTTGSGTVDSWTLVHRAPRPDVPTPYVVARVRLAEGPILLTQLLDDHTWTIDEAVVVDWHEVPDGRALPVFRRP
ncbi:MAG TPA: OB-fold domain-containing protein [Marmoricola sp.]|nr:OB-fold domain-containing protein [Marmoricola sp.]